MSADFKPRPSAGARLMLGLALGGVLVYGAYAVSDAVAQTKCAPLPITSDEAGEPCAVTPEERLRDQLKRERIQHTLVRQSLLRENRNLRRTLNTDPTVREAVTIASLVSGVPASRVWAVVRCESGGDATVSNHTGSGAAGLVQYLPSTWRATTFGKHGLNVYSPYANVIQGALAMRHSMSPWAASRHCWEGR